MGRRERQRHHPSFPAIQLGPSRIASRHLQRHKRWSTPASPASARCLCTRRLTYRLSSSLQLATSARHNMSAQPTCVPTFCVMPRAVNLTCPNLPSPTVKQADEQQKNVGNKNRRQQVGSILSPTCGVYCFSIRSLAYLVESSRNNGD